MARIEVRLISLVTNDYTTVRHLTIRVPVPFQREGMCGTPKRALQRQSILYKFTGMKQWQ